tara:strand:- start:66 stop:1385 length:1320 start_codon:yes stop_codon:yes gene_type:complete
MALTKSIFQFVFFLFCCGSYFSQVINLSLAEALQDKIDSIQNENNLQGISAAVLIPGEGQWAGVNGFSHNGNPISSDMEFGIASNTKLFTGVLMLKLIENNLFNLDDSIYQFIPSYENIDSTITIRQLLNNTSGLADVTSVEGYPDSILSDPNRMYTASELMTWAGPPSFAPGTGWEYCNTNYLLCGMIAEATTGFSYAQLLRDSILDPLDLDSTFLDVYEIIPYTIAHPWQGGMDNYSIPRTSLNSAAWSAGAMYSTSEEMIHWYDHLFNGDFLNASSFNEMTTFVGSGNYGIGISEVTINGRIVWQHGGTIWGGYNSSMMYDTETGVIICVLINQLPAQAYLVAIQLLQTILNNSDLNQGELNDVNAPFLYPNPTSNIVHIDVEKENLIRMDLLNSKGQIIKIIHATEFDISDLPRGLYYVKILTKSKEVSYRLVRQ